VLAVFGKGGWVVDFVACYGGDEFLGGIIYWVSDYDAIGLNDGFGCASSLGGIGQFVGRSIGL
jgi:hypothetical protein